MVSVLLPLQYGETDLHLKKYQHYAYKFLFALLVNAITALLTYRTYELTASCMLSASNVAEIRAQWYDSTGAALMGAVAVWRTTTAGSHDGIQCIAKAIWTPSIDSFALVQMLASGTAGTTLKQIGSWAQIVELSR